MPTMVRDSVEYLTFTLTDRDGADLSGDAVQVALVTPGVDPTWLPCTYVSGTTWRTTDVITWSTANYPERRYVAYAKAADSPETPWANLGSVYIEEH